jgi:hypothetical protein
MPICTPSMIADDSNVALEIRVARAIHLSHAALTESSITSHAPSFMPAFKAMV